MTKCLHAADKCTSHCDTSQPRQRGDKWFTQSHWEREKGSRSFKTSGSILKLSFLVESIASRCIARLWMGGRAGFRAAALICYPLSAEDGADKMLRHLQRSAPDGGGRALGRLFTGGVFHAGKREGEVQLHNFTIFCHFQVSHVLHCLTAQTGSSSELPGSVEVSLPMVGSWNWEVFKALCNPNHSVIPWKASITERQRRMPAKAPAQ